MMSKKKRLADFALRVSDDPGDVRSAPGLGRFITVHPMADETSLLKKLRVDPQECDKVDLYWEYEGDVYFIEVRGISNAYRPVGIYARLTDRGSVTIQVCISEAAITSTLVESALRELVRILPMLPELTPSLVKVSS
jgi:hypothetical protein